MIRKVLQNMGRGLAAVLVGLLYAFIGFFIGGIVGIPFIFIFSYENLIVYTAFLGVLIGAIYGFTSVWFDTGEE